MACVLLELSQIGGVSGEGWIRTNDACEAWAVLKTAAINHSATSPTRQQLRRFEVGVQRKSPVFLKYFRGHNQSQYSDTAIQPVSHNVFSLLSHCDAIWYDVGILSRYAMRYQNIETGYAFVI
ncbi:MAG TPA: hypothetical protein VNU95_12500 [Candidatus Acidoferrales bacterium]|jgi:hypothetical protein|nr:hypothetical protein [Candidatus Acidoferrales bacterium]